MAFMAWCRRGWRRGLAVGGGLMLLGGGLIGLWTGTALALPQTTASDASLPAVELRGYRFHAQTLGSPELPVLVVLHGGPGADYRYLLGLQVLADDYHVVFYDQRGSGLSPRVPAEQITPQVFIDDLDAVVSAYGRGHPVVLLGHSWGAMLASAYTGQHPEKVARLVLAEPGFLDSSTLPATMQRHWPGWTVIWGVARAWLGQWWVPTEGDPYARRDAFLTQALPYFQAGATCDGRVPVIPGWRAGSPAFDATIGRMDEPDFVATLNFRAGVEHYAGPTLFLAGACSPDTGEALQRRHLAYFAHAQLAVVEGAGHMLFNDQPERTLALVRAFLREGGAGVLRRSTLPKSPETP